MAESLENNDFLALPLHMAKKKTGKKIKEKAPKTAQPKIEEIEKENPFDFGGLPDRNLKKNLGCG